MTSVAVIGGGPAGLFAAEQLAGSGHAVTIYDGMASPARKFLLAGRGGLNLTHSEAAAPFLDRYGAAAAWMAPALQQFSPDDLRSWCEGLGQTIFVGSSGRVFPTVFKAAPLLRAWLRRLDAMGVIFAARHRWLGWGAGGALQFSTPGGELAIQASATLLALGGASWPRMGSDGAWVDVLRARDVEVAALRPSNCGVCIGWSDVFRGRHEGAPLKRIALAAGGKIVRGEAVVTKAGLEGGAVYALSAPLRSELDATGSAALNMDLRPDIEAAALALRVDGPRQGVSLSNFLRQQAGLPPVAIGLVQEALHAGAGGVALSHLIKNLPLTVQGLQPIARAISSAGGIRLSELDSTLMLKRLPGTFAAGEMLDWEAPTGGYLLQACFSTAFRASHAMNAWLIS